MKRKAKCSRQDGPVDLENQIRDAIVDSGEQANHIAVRAGVPQATLSLFINRKRGITLATASKLAQHLGLKLVSTKPGKSETTTKPGRS